MNLSAIMTSASILGLTAAGLAAPAFAQSTAQLDEIVVTAQRREENVQKASISIEAISSQTLVDRGVNHSQALNDIVPGLKIAYTGNYVQAFVRGVGDNTANAYTQASVSLNMDGVYVARSSAFGSVFFDAARVEVLRGPQGTLYGRNSSGGAINVITRTPELGEFGGYVALEGGNYDLVRAQGAVNIPVTDTLAFRAAAQSVRHDGYLSDGANNEDSSAVRVRGLWEPSENLSLLVTAEGSHSDSVYGRVYRPSPYGDPWVSSQDTRFGNVALYPTSPVRYPNATNTDAWNVSAELNWTFGPGLTLTVLPAYRDVKTIGNTAGDFLVASTDDSQQSSLETRLSADTDRLKWVVGAYYFLEDLSTFVTVDQRQQGTLSGRLQRHLVPSLETEAWAAFGETTFSVTDKLRLVAGLRYTEETRTRQGTVIDQVYTAGAVTAAGSLDVRGRTAVDAVTYRAGAEYDLAEQNMLYLTISRGFKSGGFDAATADTYLPEFVTAYTFGSKNRFLDDTLQANFELFYWKFKDQQTQFLGLDSRGLINFITRNAGQATIYGADFDFIWKFTPNDTLDGGVEYLKTEYDRFLYITPGVTPAGVRLADGCVSGGSAGVRLIFADCSGNPLPRSPEWSGNVRYTHRFDLDGGANLTAGLTAKFQSDHFLQVNYSSPHFRQDAYQTWDVDLTYTSPDGAWSVQGWVRNIGEEAVYLTAANSSIGVVAPAAGPVRSSVSAIAPPRTYGVRFQANF